VQSSKHDWFSQRRKQWFWRTQVGSWSQLSNASQQHLVHAANPNSGPHLFPSSLRITAEGHSISHLAALQWLNVHVSGDMSAEGTRPRHRVAQSVSPLGHAAMQAW